MRWCSGTRFWALTKPLCVGIKLASESSIGRESRRCPMTEEFGTGHRPALAGAQSTIVEGRKLRVGLKGLYVRHFECFFCAGRGEFLVMSLRWIVVSVDEVGFRVGLRQGSLCAKCISELLIGQSWLLCKRVSWRGNHVLATRVALSSTHPHINTATVDTIT